METGARGSSRLPVMTAFAAPLPPPYTDVEEENVAIIQEVPLHIELVHALVHAHDG